MVLLSLFAFLVVVDSWPVQLIQPDWILTFSGTLANAVSFPLVGIALIHIAGFLAPEAKGKLQIRMGRLAALLALLFLLLQPMLGFAVWRNVVNLSAFNRQKLAEINKKGNELKQAVESSNSFATLQMRMAQLQGPPIPEQGRFVEFNELKRQTLLAIKAFQESYSNRLLSPTSPAYNEVYKRVIRTSGLSLIALVGFALLAWNPANNTNLLLNFFRSVGLFGLTPASIYSGAVNWIATYQTRQEESHALRQKRRAALQYQRQMRRGEAMEIENEKRNQMAEQKRARKLRLERERMQELERKLQRKRELEQERRRKDP